MSEHQSNDEDLVKKIRSEIYESDAALFVPHQRRGALLHLDEKRDFLECALAIAKDDSTYIKEAIESNVLSKPTLSDIADWCVDLELRFQTIVLQPFVLTQKLPQSSDEET